MLANNTAKDTDTMVDPFSNVEFRIVKENTPPDKLTPSQREILKVIENTIASFREDGIKGILSHEVTPGSAPLDLAQFGIPKNNESVAPDEPFSNDDSEKSNKIAA